MTNGGLPGFFCSVCRVFTGTAKEEHLTCRACGAPRPPDNDKIMLRTLTAAQEASTKLALENQRLRATLRTIRSIAEDARRALCQIPDGGALTRDRMEFLLRSYLAVTGACEAHGVRT
jgi:hypothetical protein